MCGDHDKPGHGWQGWLACPPPEPQVSAAPWQDCSHKLSETMPNASVFPTPRFRRLKSMPDDPLNVTEMRMAVHSGTHVDAPLHFFIDGPAIDAIPLDRLWGAGAILRIAAEPCAPITAAMLEAQAALVRPGDIIGFDTSWSRHAGTPQYERHPYIGDDAAHWLVDHQIKLIACDFPSADLPIIARKPGFSWPAHHILLSQGVLVSEHFAPAIGLAGQRVEFMFNALNIAGSDGAPARVLARPIHWSSSQSLERAPRH